MNNMNNMNNISNMSNMSNMNNSSMFGLENLLHLEGDMDIDIDELEREITGGFKKESPHDLFQSELDHIDNEIKMTSKRPINELRYPAPVELKEFVEDDERPSKAISFNDDFFMPDTNFGSSSKPRYDSSYTSSKSRSKRVLLDDDDDDGDESQTKEQQKSDVVNRALKQLSQNSNLGEFNLDKEAEEEEKIYLLTEIETYTDILKNERIPFDNVVIPSRSSTIQEIRSAHERLRLKIDYNRSCILAEEMLIAGAHILEGIFNGKRSFLGKTPDLTGWSTTVAVKSKGLRHDMSSFVNKTFRYHKWGPAARLAIELIPSLIMYSSMQSSKKSGDFYSSQEMSRAFDNVRDVEDGNV